VPENLEGQAVLIRQMMTMNTPPLVYVILLNWNGWEDTRECLDSCLKISYPNYRILVVDNGSTDGSGDMIRERYGSIELIQTGSNLGFTGGNNIGMRHALNKGADYVLLLNNDTIVDPAFVTELVAAMETDKMVGIACSKIYFYDHPDVFWYAGASFHPWLGWGRHRGYGQRDTGQFDRVEQTVRPTGCALMASRELCSAVGLLREEFFIYCEDTDWGMRTRNAGYKVLYVPGSRLWHKVSRVMGRMSGASQYYSARNILACIDTNAPLPAVLRHVRYAIVLANLLLGLVTQNIPKRTGLRYLLRGLRHYFEGSFGKLEAERPGKRHV